MNMPVNFRTPVTLLLVLASVSFLAARASAQTSAVQSRITQDVNDSQRTVLRGNTHPLARPQFDRGAAPSDLVMDRMLLVLKRSPEQEAAVEKLVAEQQDKSSLNYHKWLTPAQFGQQFGVSDQDIATVTRWLESHGFVVNSVAHGRDLIEFSGTAGQVAEAFHAPIHNFVVNGETHWANANDPSIPKALAPVVAGIDSLHNFYPKPMNHSRRPPQRLPGPAGDASLQRNVTFNVANPCGLTVVTQCFGLGPTDFATIYNVLPLWNAGIDGTGQTIAIVSDSNINTADVSDFRSIFGLPVNQPTVTLNGPDPGKNGDEVEAILDVEWSGAVAKNATINLVVSKSGATSGVNLSATDIVDNKLANILSVSFGECELGLGTAGNMFFNNTWSKAATEGITVLVSSGDDGSAGCDVFDPNGATVQPAQNGLAVNGIASTPFNVAVGGTEFNDISDPLQFWNSTNSASSLASAKGYVPERTYNDSCADPIVFTFFVFPNAQEACNDQTNVQPDGFVIVSGGAGGKSSCITDANQPSSCTGGYAKPSWQAALTPADSARDLPDVSLFAGDGTISGSFYVLCERDQVGGSVCNLTSSNFLEAGGTSVSTQVFAGIVALLNQKYEDKQGLINPSLYTLAKTAGNTCVSAASPSSTCMFYDVTTGTISMPCSTSPSPVNCAANGSPINILPGFDAGTGYDYATGLGTLNAANLVNASNTWASNTGGNDFSISAGTPTPVASPGGMGTVTVTVAADGAFNGMVTFACSALPSETTCSGPTVTGSGQSTITFQTTAPSMLTPTKPTARIGLPGPGAMLALVILLSIGLMWIGFSKGNRRWTTALALVVFAIVFASVGCGGGGGGTGPPPTGGTPVGTTNVVITATSGSIQRSTSVALVVN
jgi:subtilase family serine protease